MRIPINSHSSQLHPKQIHSTSPSLTYGQMALVTLREMQFLLVSFGVYMTFLLHSVGSILPPPFRQGHTCGLTRFAAPPTQQAKGWPWNGCLRHIRKPRMFLSSRQLWSIYSIHLFRALKSLPGSVHLHGCIGYRRCKRHFWRKGYGCSSAMAFSKLVSSLR
jgi:hypothetical protein